MLNVGYDNGNEIDMFIEYFGYDIMKLAELERNEVQNNNSIESSDDDYYSSDECEEIENVDFQTKGDETVVIKNISTKDPFLNKLCSTRIMFRGSAQHIETETPIVDPDDHQIDSVYKVKKGKSVKKKAVKKKSIKKQAVNKKAVSECGEGYSQSPKWTKKQILDSKKVACPFRMRVKQLALFNHEGGLIKHYGKLYEYRQALPDSNPGSTCRLDVDESANGCFKRMYICFNGVKDGWLTECTSANTRGGGMVVSSSMGVLTVEEEYQLDLDEHAFRECMEDKRTSKNRCLTRKDTTITTADIDEAPAVETTETTELGEGKATSIVEDVYAPAMDKGKAKESVADETNTQKRKKGRPPSHVDGIRIYHKNRGRSERIANMKLNKHETGSIPDKAFDVND
ncbi:hypothetical protein Tco_0969218 [Tanacetum coccineum]